MRFYDNLETHHPDPWSAARAEADVGATIIGGAILGKRAVMVADRPRGCEAIYLMQVDAGSWTMTHSEGPVRGDTRFRGGQILCDRVPEGVEAVYLQIDGERVRWRVVSGWYCFVGFQEDRRPGWHARFVQHASD